jgi:YesN/AraC family two-component response regulator
MAATGRILVVEDDQALAEAVGASLGTRYDVRCVGTGAAAIAALCEASFELILLDHRLPDLLGTDLLTLIKRFFPATTVLLMTGQGSEDVAIDALRGGARDYLRKPFSLPDLVTRVAALFAFRRQGGERRHHAAGARDTPAPASELPDPDTDRSRAILRALRHVEHHLDAALPLDAVARVAGMSRFHFCRQFKKTTGLSFRTFLARERIARAKELLRDGTQPIGHVARDLGFRDLTQFGRVFQKVQGVLPSEYRRRLSTTARE